MDVSSCIVPLGGRDDDPLGLPSVSLSTVTSTTRDGYRSDHCLFVQRTSCCYVSQSLAQPLTLFSSSRVCPSLPYD